MSNLGGGLDLLSHRADTDWQTQRRQTERQTQRRTCRYANVAAAIRRHSDNTLPSRLSALWGQPADFSLLPQAAFIFHTSGNWTLSSVIEFLGCRAYLCMGNWMQCSLLWAGLQCSVMGQWVTAEDGLLANESPHSSVSVPCVVLVEKVQMSRKKVHPLGDILQISTKCFFSFIHYKYKIIGIESIDPLKVSIYMKLKLLFRYTFSSSYSPKPMYVQ